MMQIFSRLLSRQVGYALGGMALLAALILSFGPVVSFDGYAPLTSIGNQIVACLLAPAGYAAYFLVQLRIQDTVQERMNAALNGAEAGEAAKRSAEERAAGQQEVQVIAERFRTALSRLRQRRFGKGGQRLHELPWYVIIGPPGSGKTTAIVNSGLSFPLADQLGKTPVAGIGGTRNCDWWFTDEAVLIDTAGRYVTQDSAAERDRTAWLGFLGLLRRYRRRLPLNGIIVAMAVDELAQASDAQRQEHALRIRQRVQELHRELRLRLPVYLVLTKLDLIAGFVEFFDDLGQEGRRAVWGMTFPLAEQEPEGGSVTAFAAGFEALVGRLHERLIERVQREGDLERRARIFGFPQQVASVKEATLGFLQHVFAPNSFEEPPLLRGVYFASGTQLGTPLDRVTEAMARSFAVARPRAVAFSGKQRSYFLHDLLHRVIFPEAGLAERQPGALRRRARRRMALAIGLVLAVLAGGGAWGLGYARNLRLIDDVQRTAEAVRRDAEGLALERVEEDSLPPVLPLLDRLRALAERLRQHPAHLTEAGLDQSDKLSAQAERAYRHALNGAFLPRLLLRLENLLVQRQDDPILLYQTFKVYLMLGQQGPLQREAVRGWMQRDWQASFPGEAGAARRAALLAHLDALLAEPVAGIGLNGPLVEQVRGALQRISHPQLVLNAVTGSAEASRLPPWRLADVAGPAAPDVLRRRSGQPLTAGIPGIYTSAGFHGVFLRLLPAAAAAQAEDLWLLASPGAPAPAEPTRDAARRLEREATELYLQAFSLHWDRLIGDVTVAPMADVADALRVLNVLSAPSSPIRLILFAAVRETALDRPPGEAEAERGGARPETGPRALPPADSPAGQAARYAAERFQPLRRLVEVPANSQAGAQAPIDDVLRDLEQLYRSLSELQGAASDPVRQGGLAAAAVGQIERRAALLPSPIAQWILGVSRTSSDLSLSNARQQLGEAWRSGPAALCQRVTTNRFPFAARAQAEAPLGDFARLFGPGGALDSFFTEHLQALVDTSRSPWTARAGGADAFRLPAEVIAQFERAAAIRSSLFQDGGSRPAIGVSLALAELAPATAAVQVELDGRVLRFARGEAEARRLRWPGAEGTGAASLAFEGSDGTALPAFGERGAWSLFRLLALGELRPRGEDSVQLRVAAGPHQAAFVLTPDNLANPFDPALFARFRCPAIR